MKVATKVKNIDFFQKSLPHNLEAEQAVLGGILIDNEALYQVLETIKDEDFYRDTHKKIFRAYLELFEQNQPIDLVTVSEYLQNKGELEEIGGATYLASLVEAIPTASNIAYYAKIVKEKAILRKLIACASEIIEQCLSSTDDVEEILDRSERAIFEVAGQRIQTPYFPLKDIIKDTFETLQSFSQKGNYVTGVPTGFTDFDRLTSGLQPADLIIVAGRPSMGKTAFALNIAANAAIKHRIPVAVFSLEMSKEQVAIRMLCAEAKVDTQKFRSGFLADHDWQLLTEAATLLSEAPVFIDDTPAISILELRAKARRLKSEHNIGLVIVDYLQLMKGKGRAERREQEISEISRSLKALAKELNVPVVALSQLNRRVEEREDKRPRLADLRESGAIEQDADLIVFLYRDEVYNRREDNPNRGIAEVIIGKHRNGPIGKVKLAFLDKFTSFENLKVEYDETFENWSHDSETQ
ncbi:MAG: replicative DNA helicase [Candidatus Thorarchaeota archaeon]|nr:MAG: replicative DNA helicase [Candidatus Thorarchaeota archaeon]